MGSERWRSNSNCKFASHSPISARSAVAFALLARKCVLDSSCLGCGGNAKYTFSTPSWLKSSDWIGLLGPLGVFVVERTSLAVKYKRLFQRFFLWCGAVRRKVVPSSALDQLQADGALILTEMEAMLPLYAATINQHMLLHVVERIRNAGPAWTHHM